MNDKKLNLKNVEAVIFDWAGTMVDYGCFAPLDVFIKVFAEKGIEITVKEAREPMGLKKIDHIRAIAAQKRIKKLWQDKFAQEITESEIEELYQSFKKNLFKILPDYAKPVPGAVELFEKIKNSDLKVGSTTGYTSEMMEIVAPKAAESGYKPDSIVTSTEVPAGRPAPFMCYQNAIKLGVYPLHKIVKIGDTISDIKEGKNAGAWSVGVIKGSSKLGLSQKELCKMPSDELELRMEKTARAFKKAGADFVIEEISDAAKLLFQIDKKIAGGELPQSYGAGNNE
ncbi:MAG: phosphonoacetaldehyde hydrolase [Halanaerobium sp.]